MKMEIWFSWKRNWPLWTLLILFIFAFFWWGLWSNGAFLRWWRSLEEWLPASVFFVGEEFIALHSHNNEWPGRCGFYLIIITCMVFLLRRMANTIQIHACTLLVIMGFTVFFLLFSICLCRAKEKENRRFCTYDLKNYYQALTNYAVDNGFYPAALPKTDEKNEKYRPRHFLHEKDFHYIGAGKKTDGSRFLIMEDAPRAHAGDLRHRLWSDGTTDFYYPWK